MFAWLVAIVHCLFFNYFRKTVKRWDITVGPHGFTPARVGRDRERYELFCSTAQVIHPGMRLLIETDVNISFSKQSYGKIVIDSSLAEYGVSVDGGLLTNDEDIRVVLINKGRVPVALHRGERFAHLICERIN